MIVETDIRLHSLIVATVVMAIIIITVVTVPNRSLPPAGAVITVDRLRSTMTFRGCDLTVAKCIYLVANCSQSARLKFVDEVKNQQNR